MSPPAMKWRPAPVITSARSSGSSPTVRTCSWIAAPTSGCSAFTGGLSIVISAIRPRRSSRTSKAKREPSADDERLPGDVARLRRGEEGDAGPDLGRRARPAHRDPRLALLLVLLGDRAEHAGVDQPRRDAVDRHAVLRR